MASPKQTEKIPCPRSLEGYSPDLADYELHYASAAELEANHGVCASCAEKFRKSKGNYRGRLSASENHNHHGHRLDIQNDIHAFSDLGEPERFETFDFDAIDRALADLEAEPLDVQRAAATVLARIFTYVWRSNPTSKTGLRTALVKFTSVCAALRPDLLNDQSFQELGDKLGVTKAAISKCVVLAEAALGLKFARTRSDSARASMSQAALRRGARKKVGTPPP